MFERDRYVKPERKERADDPIKFVSNVQILNCNIHDNPGTPDIPDYESGWGIFIWGGQYITIQGNTINHNGEADAGSGITVFVGDMVLIQGNAVTNQQNGSGVNQDGTGIECANTGCSRVVCQFNFVANNKGGRHPGGAI